jgi:hypothetical protein
MLKLHFDYFTNGEKFINIKRKFLFKDYSFDHEDAHISQVNLEIDDIVRVRKTNADVNEADETSVLSQNFYKDHIPLSVIKISEKYKKEFMEAFDGDYSILEIGEDKFKRIELGKLNVISKEIENAPHLIKSLKETIHKAIDELYGFVNAYKQKEVKDKIPFNLSKNEVITLFHLLYQKGHISQELNKNDISRLIGRNFEYFNKTEKKYMPIVKPGKQENNLLTDHASSSPDLTLRKLKKIFRDKDFFTSTIDVKTGDKKITS